MDILLIIAGVVIGSIASGIVYYRRSISGVLIIDPNDNFYVDFTMDAKGPSVYKNLIRNKVERVILRIDTVSTLK